MSSLFRHRSMIIAENLVRLSKVIMIIQRSSTILISKFESFVEIHRDSLLTCSSPSTNTLRLFTGHTHDKRYNEILECSPCCFLRSMLFFHTLQSHRTFYQDQAAACNDFRQSTKIPRDYWINRDHFDRLIMSIIMLTYLFVNRQRNNKSQMSFYLPSAMAEHVPVQAEETKPYHRLHSRAKVRSHFH
jgi:hypothetical protein